MSYGTGTNYVTKLKNSMAGMGVSAASASQAMTNFGVVASGFPSADEALDLAMMMDRAMQQLREDEGPPDEIRVLADERAAHLGVEVTFEREVQGGQLEWRVSVKTKRGTLRARPTISEKALRELAETMIPVTAWKNALSEVGLL